MHLKAIRNAKSPEDLNLLDQMHQLRATVFEGRLSWNVHCFDGREFDEFDTLSPTYILAIASDERVVGCARLLPAVGTTMLQTIFPQLLETGQLASHRRMIESSRFCVDTAFIEGRGAGSPHSATLAMFAGLVEWSMLNGYSEIATATDVRFERILRRAGWPMRRLGSPTMINETHSVAGVLVADQASFDRLRPEHYRSSFVTLQQKAA
ncbi:acyl homoserine lactone synthase [Rhizobium aethiopicum]|uniref:acyl-homoserine-lactone synthase n=1 Tax=Rhizobium aethiopicum TaxID=1138170 RepID=UPI00161254CB|nr:acyl-homoserine-lactone synthase TraI [Rhizobium aethiopicum]MBB4581532.1 acyl homoserine lactone synthase [Rhizobium aethiopicum]